MGQSKIKGGLGNTDFLSSFPNTISAAYNRKRDKGKTAPSSGKLLNSGHPRLYVFF